MKLTRKQQLYIEYSCNNPLLSDYQCGLDLNISAKQICQWKKNPEFRAEINKELDRRWAESRALAQDKLFELLNCGKADIEYKVAEFLMKTNGVDSINNVNLQAGIEVSIDYGENSGTNESNI